MRLSCFAARLAFLAVLLASGAAAALGGAGAAHAAPGADPAPGKPVALELALAVDVSASISGGAMDFQFRGHAQAFRDPRLIQAIEASGGTGVAVAVIGFSGPGSARVLVPWTLVRGAADARAFADRVEAIARPEGAGSTAIGSALDAIRPMFAGNGFSGAQRTVDIVSNGFSNGGAPVEAARDRAVADGLTVNALVILDEYDWLEGYFAESVIGGPGSFVRTAESRESFAEALVQKLIAEMVQVRPVEGGADFAALAPEPVGSSRLIAASLRGARRNR
ncbi:DUF1194 domain-containing protein [Arenibaculum pallidiluteum]|uniref:DUF1194 domain-containing protein n=1 Tax=Arenibaculum pallidiluteum TaxID=2812559 RepID=UPI001A967A84|nr:DUF1194 domain-containing protein [Arenibaculum pallidiluteum]